MDSKTNRIAGASIIAVGVIFLIGNLFEGIELWGFILRLWPLALVFLGIYLIKRHKDIKSDNGIDIGASGNTLFGDIRTVISDQEPVSQRYSTFIGDIKIDMTAAKFNSGENRVSVFSLLGDVDLKIPDGLPMSLSSWSAIGDMKFDDLRRDGFFQRLEHTDAAFANANDRLLLTVTCVIGDLNLERVKIKDVN